MTYTRCSICNGSLTLSADIGGVEAEHRCPCTRSPTPGWSPTGVTLAQIDRMVDVERALAGDPGLPEQRRLEILTELDRKIGKLCAAVRFTARTNKEARKP